MGKPSKRKRPATVADLESQLERARRREAQTARRRRIDLATLDEPDVSHADQWAAFLNRPGRFYVANIEIPLDDLPLGEKLGTTTTFKADDEQIIYLVEVLRQIRGALGERCRIELTPAEPNVEKRRIAGPPSVRGVGRAHQEARDAVMARSAEPCEHTERPATAEELAMVREMRARAEKRKTLGDPTREPGEPFADGPPMVPGTPGGPWIQADREFSREELVEMMPGQTRAEVAAELGKAPEDLGGTVYHADEMPEKIAADLGVPVESLRRLPMQGGGYAWSVVPIEPPEEPAGRHAKPDGDDGDDLDNLPGESHGPHGIYQTTVTAGEGEAVECRCGVVFRDQPGVGIYARAEWREHREMEAGCRCPRGMGASMRRTNTAPDCPTHGDPTSIKPRAIRDEPQA